MAQEIISQVQNYPLSDIVSVEWRPASFLIGVKYTPLNPQLESTFVGLSKPNWFALLQLFPQVRQFLEGDESVKVLGPIKYHAKSKYFQVVRTRNPELKALIYLQTFSLAGYPMKDYNISLNWHEWKNLEQLHHKISKELEAAGAKPRKAEPTLRLYQWNLQGEQIQGDFTSSLKFYSEGEAKEHFLTNFPFSSPGEMNISQVKVPVPEVMHILKKALIVGLVEYIKLELGQDSLTLADITSHLETCLPKLADPNVLHHILAQVWGQMEIVPEVPFPVVEPGDLKEEVVNLRKEGGVTAEQLHQVVQFGEFMCDVRLLNRVLKESWEGISKLMN